MYDDGPQTVIRRNVCMCAVLASKWERCQSLDLTVQLFSQPLSAARRVVFLSLS